MGVGRGGRGRSWEPSSKGWVRDCTESKGGTYGELVWGGGENQCLRVQGVEG